MIIITGAAGFIGSCLVGKLNQEGFNDLILVDDFSSPQKKANWETKRFSQTVHRDHFFDWIQGKEHLVQFIFHLGARTDTSETSVEIFNRLNLHYSQNIWRLCAAHQIPLVYASSAATYGAGEQGFDDDLKKINLLQPQNEYARSKHKFDLWALAQEDKPYFWAGLKFFNVYGPNEYHKGRMASVIFHAYQQIHSTQQIQLFKSHRPDFADGEQKRDFIYVKEIINILLFFMYNRKQSGIYNAGTGKARSFNELSNAIFNAIGQKPNIQYIETPENIRTAYQYFTEARMDKLRNTGYQDPSISIENGVWDYVKEYLAKNTFI